MTRRMHFGLADILKRHNISQKQLADAANMRPATVNAIVHARVERIETGTLLSLLDGLEQLGVEADVGDLLHAVKVPDEQAQAAHERALRLLGGDPWGLKPAGLAEPVAVSGPPIEDLLPELLESAR